MTVSLLPCYIYLKYKSLIYIYIFFVFLATAVLLPSSYLFLEDLAILGLLKGTGKNKFYVFSSGKLLKLFLYHNLAYFYSY